MDFGRNHSFNEGQSFKRNIRLSVASALSTLGEKPNQLLGPRSSDIEDGPPEEAKTACSCGGDMKKAVCYGFVVMGCIAVIVVFTGLITFGLLHIKSPIVEEMRKSQEVKARLFEEYQSRLLQEQRSPKVVSARGMVNLELTNTSKLLLSLNKELNENYTQGQFSEYITGIIVRNVSRKTGEFYMGVLLKKTYLHENLIIAMNMFLMDHEGRLKDVTLIPRSLQYIDKPLGDNEWEMIAESITFGLDDSGLEDILSENSSLVVCECAQQESLEKGLLKLNTSFESFDTSIPDHFVSLNSTGEPSPDLTSQRNNSKILNVAAWNMSEEMARPRPEDLGVLNPTVPGRVILDSNITNNSVTTVRSERLQRTDLTSLLKMETERFGDPFLGKPRTARPSKWGSNPFYGVTVPKNRSPSSTIAPNISLLSLEGISGPVMPTPGEVAAPVMPTPGEVSAPVMPTPGEVSAPVMPTPGEVSAPVMPTLGEAVPTRRVAPTTTAPIPEAPLFRILEPSDTEGSDKGDESRGTEDHPSLDRLPEYLNFWDTSALSPGSRYTGGKPVPLGGNDTPPWRLDNPVVREPQVYPGSSQSSELHPGRPDPPVPGHPHHIIPANSMVYSVLPDTFEHEPGQGPSGGRGTPGARGVPPYLTSGRREADSRPQTDGRPSLAGASSQLGINPPSPVLPPRMSVTPLHQGRAWHGEHDYQVNHESKPAWIGHRYRGA